VVNIDIVKIIQLVHLNSLSQQGLVSCSQFNYQFSPCRKFLSFLWTFLRGTLDITIAGCPFDIFSF
jgi:hypothetical protein